jgi:hypothetical protein
MKPERDVPHDYEIHVEGHLSDSWTDWFEGLEICREYSGETILRGPILDQAALFGVLIKILALNLSLVSVVRNSTLVAL